MSSTLPKVLGPDGLKIAKEAARALRELKKVDPRDRFVLLIPDSDRAHVGMGFKLLNVAPAEQVYEMASDILKRDVLKLCLDGPKEELLRSKENMNIAAYVTSHATFAKLKHQQPAMAERCKAAGGIGTGFINALVLGESITFENGLELVQRQGQAMDRAAQIVPGGRVKLRILPATSKHKVCLAAVEHCLKMGIPEELAVCAVTKQLRPHVLEISGHEEAIKYLEGEGQRLFKFRWISRDGKVPHAFHTKLMEPAAQFLKGYIEQRIEQDPDYIREPLSCSAYSANAACRLRAPKHIKKDLIYSPVKPLKIEQLLQLMYIRPRDKPQPNTLVLWDRQLLTILAGINRLAFESAKLYT